jgi:hypothetical protein
MEATGILYVATRFQLSLTQDSTQVDNVSIGVLASSLPYSREMRDCDE